MLFLKSGMPIGPHEPWGKRLPLMKLLTTLVDVDLPLTALWRVVC